MQGSRLILLCHFTDLPHFWNKANMQTDPFQCSWLLSDTVGNCFDAHHSMIAHHLFQIKYLINLSILVSSREHVKTVMVNLSNTVSTVK